MEQKKKSELTRAKILEAAEESFAAVGLAAARVDDIAARAGVNKQLIYAHFSSKEGLYTAVLTRVYERLKRHQRIISQMPAEGLETVRGIVTHYFDFLISDPHFVRLMLWENLNGGRYLQPDGEDPFAGIRALLRRAQEAGIIRPDLDVEETVISLNMFCFSAFSNVYTLSGLLDREMYTEEALRARAAHITDVFIKYICLA